MDFNKFPRVPTTGGAAAVGADQSAPRDDRFNVFMSIIAPP